MMRQGSSQPTKLSGKTYTKKCYDPKMRSAGYSEEDMHLFQDAWKSMIAEDVK